MTRPGIVASATIVLIALAGLVPACAADIPPMPPLKTFHTEVPVARDGSAVCVIAVPPGDGYRQLGEKLASAIQTASGAVVPVRDASLMSVDDLGRTNLILLGYFATNPLIGRLYDGYFVALDSQWPGAGGYVIRTVHDPLASGTSCVCLSGADVAATGRAVDDFISTLPAKDSIAIGHTLRVVLPNGQLAYTPAADKIPARIEAARDKKFRTASSLLTAAGYNYFRTGNPDEIEVFKGIFPHVMKAGRSLGQIGDMMALVGAMPAWDAMEEAPQFSGRDREQITAAFWELTHRFALAGAKAEDRPTPPGNNTNARTASDMARYWMTYYGVDAGGLWSWVNTYFRSQAKFWRPSEDCPGYGGSTMMDLLYWALPFGYEQYWQDGTGRKLADYGFAVMNNLGGHAGFGDTSAWMNPGHWPVILRVAAWKLQDGRYLYAAQRAKRSAGRLFASTYVQDQLQPEKPAEMMGIHVVELPGWVYKYRENLRTAPTFMNSVLDADPVPPRAECFDKIVFRTSMDPEDQYLILGGISHGYHAHPDGNAIIEYTDSGRYCLFDSGYFVPDTIEHNTVIVFRDGLFEPVPRLTGLATLGDFTRLGMVQTYVHGYNGADWRRNIIWRKEKYFLVIDEIEAVEPGNYGLLAVFRTLDDDQPEVGKDRVRAVSAGRAFNIVSGSHASFRIAGTRPPVAVRHAVLESKTARMKAGDVTRLSNLLYADDLDGWKYEMVPAGDGAVMISSPEGYAVAGVGPCQPLAGMSIVAEQFHVSRDAFAMTGACALDIGQAVFRSEQPVNIEINLGSTATGSIDAEQDTNICLPAAGSEVRLDGRTVQTRPTSHGACFGVPAGRHRLAFKPSVSGFDVSSWAGAYEQFGRHHEQKLAELEAAPTGRRMEAAWAVNNSLTADPGEERPAVVNDLVAHDIDGDGADEVVSVAGPLVKCITGSGDVVWEKTLEAEALCVEACDLDGDGFSEVVVGAADFKLYCFDRQGRERWSVLTPADRAYPEREPAHGRVEVVGCADIDADGDAEIVIGCSHQRGGINWHAYAYSHDGKLLWTALNWAHQPTSISFVPMQDGKLASLISTTYNAANVFGPDGKKIGIVGVGYHGAATTTAAGDINGDGIPELLAGSRVGGIHCTVPNDPPGLELTGRLYGREGNQTANRELWARFMGAEVTKLALSDLTGDGKLEVIAGSRSFYLLVMDAAGEAIWARNIGEAVTDVVAADLDGDAAPEIAVGTGAGLVNVVDARGQMVGALRAGGPVSKLAVADLNGDGRQQLVAAAGSRIHGDIK